MSDNCSICGGEETPHREAEDAGTLNHQFSTLGQLLPVDRSARARRQQQRQQPILVVGAIDTELRRLLIDKGILTDEDFAAVRRPGTSAAGDRDDRETPPAE